MLFFWRADGERLLQTSEGMTIPLPRILFAVLALVGAMRGVSTAAALPSIASNDNTHLAGTLDRNGLAVSLVARDGLWYPDGAGTIGVPVGAFGEFGKPLALPGPLLRVNAGTPVTVELRNAFPRETLHVYGLSGERSGFVTLPPGATRRFHFLRTVPGTYSYWANDASESQRMRGGHDAGLSGAIVVDDLLERLPSRRFAELSVRTRYDQWPFLAGNGSTRVHAR
jgi:FtsP/CotA-like multicopper oxidase with cupredoxin domain